MSRLLMLLLFLSPFLHAAPGDTIEVAAFQDAIIRTNPAVGNAYYPVWAQFPAQGTQIRKAWISMNYKCPPGENCGEWDYLDYIFLRRRGGVNASSEDIEIARFITPYGNSYNSSWTADWEIDVTDWEQLLRDSVEIEYIHGGYETNVGKGWLVNLSFNFIEGTPTRDLLRVNRVWNGGFGFGNQSNPINNQLAEQNISLLPETRSYRFRINQTGHGSVQPDFCAEFCPKSRFLLRNGSVFDTRQVWRDDCGLNPVFPQAGTWLYDRAAWCPGQMVFPDVYEFPASGAEDLSLRMEMEDYTAAGGGANYVIHSYLMEYTAPAFEADAAIEDIKAPSKKYQYRRFNPICGQPVIVVRNNGSNTLSSINISYGASGMSRSTYIWNGTLEFNQSVDIVLPGTVEWGSEAGVFVAEITGVNGGQDAYALNNVHYSQFEAPLTIPGDRFVVDFGTNNFPQENYWKIYDIQGNEVASSGPLTANSNFRDTIDLPWGCYTFILEDLDKDGLNFWANDDGNGYLRFRRADANSIFKNFAGDFGTRLVVPFTLGGSLGIEKTQDESPLLFYPNPTDGLLHVQVTLKGKQNLKLKLMNLQGKTLFEENSVSNGIYKTTFECSSLAKGLYLLQVEGEDFRAVEKVVVR